jgi:hypothetical protein
MPRLAAFGVKGGEQGRSQESRFGCGLNLTAFAPGKGLAMTGDIVMILC